ncbi:MULTISPECIES: hydrogen peroxide-inducible genes activator [unclassified Chelatococcus]|uniref:hydrogen peroxide-inducible genes activator n=1 Tax=unclassified Chelatococcus TaxID=2638111 RepID=UPI001BCFAA43|nr:hydrogen peroxide-inducible genes activator [Chelatococcus sp.]MBS7698698.1 LysR family transcriptional regulator [Chelatococcus sp. YT9]MBX3554720.1 LysR family transcriptional regulator [Chelatococcus sp.]
MLNVSFRQLHYLVALAETMSFSRAAERVGVTQSTLSAAIRALEAELGTELVDRSARAIQLLPAGEAITRRAKSIIGLVEELPDHVAGALRPLTTPLRLGVIPSVAPFILPKVVPSLRDAYPELHLFVREGLTRSLLEALRNGGLDAALIATPYAIEGLDCEILGDDLFHLAVPLDHPFANRETVEFGELRGERLLLLEAGHCLREHVIAAIGLDDLPEAEDVRAASIMTLVQMVEFGMGVTLLPDIAVEAGATRGARLQLLPYANTRAKRSLALVWRTGAARRGDYLLLANHLRDYCLPHRPVKTNI